MGTNLQMMDAYLVKVSSCSAKSAEFHLRKLTTSVWFGLVLLRTFQTRYSVPFMKCRWKVRKIINTGIMASTLMANRLFNPVELAYKVGNGDLNGGISARC